MADRLPDTSAGRPDGSDYPLLDVGGPTVHPLILGDVNVLRGTIPPGRFVPLHAHLTHSETFVVESGEMQGLLVSESGEPSWAAVRPGELAYVPTGVRIAVGERRRRPRPRSAGASLMTRRGSGST